MTVRLCGIDAPEKSQQLGAESKANLQKLVDVSDEVQLMILDTDHYGRKVAEAFVVLKDGSEQSLQQEQLTAGLAYHYAKYSANCPNQGAMILAEEIGKESHRGVWALPGGGVRPWDYRKAR